MSQGEVARTELERNLADRQSELKSLKKKVSVLEHQIANFTQNAATDNSSLVDRNPDERQAQAHLQNIIDGERKIGSQSISRK